MKTLGYMILSTTLIAGPLSAEEKTEAPSTLPATELTNTVNTTTTEPPTLLTQETQVETTQEQAQPMEKAESDTALAEQSGFNPGTVARSAFTSSIDNREPVDMLQKMHAMDQKVYFFTELRDMEGQTATHRWELNDEVMAEVAFEVKGPRWRVWSSKNLQPEWVGEWKVSVLNSAKEVISETSLNVTSVTEGETAPATAAPAEPNI
ncbi:MAG: DUF2914 domain-containing protein [Gammaproteobacteria bacterium]|nr:DUF2914 domain-containing protein [Gammaproteobacteria bacterium]